MIEDAPVLAEIYVKSSNAAFSAWQPAMRLTQDGIGGWAADVAEPAHHWWVAEANGVPVGFAGIGPSRDPVSEENGELDTIAILPEYWRRGIGRSLMRRANEQLDLDGYQRAVLWTWTEYPAAANFYETAGWSRSRFHRDGGRQVSYWRRCAAG